MLILSSVMHDERGTREAQVVARVPVPWSSKPPKSKFFSAILWELVATPRIQYTFRKDKYWTPSTLVLLIRRRETCNKCVRPPQITVHSKLEIRTPVIVVLQLSAGRWYIRPPIMWHVNFGGLSAGGKRQLAVSGTARLMSDRHDTPNCR